MMTIEEETSEDKEPEEGEGGVKAGMMGTSGEGGGMGEGETERETGEDEDSTGEDEDSQGKRPVGRRRRGECEEQRGEET